MSKDKTASDSALALFFQELLHAGIYKRSQGRMTRQVTCLAIWLFVGLAAYKMAAVGGWDFGNKNLKDSLWLGSAVAGTFLAVGLWLGYRVVNYPPFADFLIAVEAEMNKVSWPSQTELVRSSIVVIVLIFLLTAIVFGSDLLIQGIMKLISVR